MLFLRKRHNQDLESLAGEGRWPDFPDELACIIDFLFPGEQDPKVVKTIFSITI